MVRARADSRSGARMLRPLRCLVREFLRQRGPCRLAATIAALSLCASASSALAATSPMSDLLVPSASQRLRDVGHLYNVEIRTEAGRPPNNTVLSREAGDVVFDLLAGNLADVFPGGNNNAGPVEVLESVMPSTPGFDAITITINNLGTNGTGFASLFDPAGSAAIVRFTGLEFEDIYGGPAGTPMVLAPGATINYTLRDTLGNVLVVSPPPVDTNFFGQGTPTLGFQYNITTSGNVTISQVVINFKLAVPEPGTLVLLGAALPILAHRRRRRSAH